MLVPSNAHILLVLLLKNYIGMLLQAVTFGLPQFKSSKFEKSMISPVPNRWRIIQEGFKINLNVHLSTCLHNCSIDFLSTTKIVVYKVSKHILRKKNIYSA